MLSRTLVRNRLRQPSRRNLQECKPQGTAVKRGGGKRLNLDRNEKDDETTKSANRYPKRLQALKLQTDKILTLCDRE